MHNTPAVTARGNGSPASRENMNLKPGFSSRLLELITAMKQYRVYMRPQTYHLATPAKLIIHSEI